MILFVCSQGMLRSRTAELLCLFGGVTARSAGTDPDAEVQVNDTLIRKADLIVCMEGHHKKALREFQHYGASPVVTLGIPDEFDRLDHMLVRSLIYHTRLHDVSVADAMERGYGLLKDQAGYCEALGTRTPSFADNPAFGGLPQ